jgi:hypothetical protein
VTVTVTVTVYCERTNKRTRVACGELKSVAAVKLCQGGQMTNGRSVGQSSGRRTDKTEVLPNGKGSGPEMGA